jgi:hypothetical protein
VKAEGPPKRPSDGDWAVGQVHLICPSHGANHWVPCRCGEYTSSSTTAAHTTFMSRVTQNMSEGCSWWLLADEARKRAERGLSPYLAFGRTDTEAPSVLVQFRDEGGS